ncbi:hypothetical protein [Streptosporangium roseum]|uniref:Uncharacterized protein n=1 Tax=Streptosporangium roseum (strain ATCC 12428 / DSM 43021 / JCM 3005 / KCTC 9067 / NCIMB 10171 / NRRL 2505 / NI 9100) TaxID=479432 RepID=D2AYT2_STRRD|nr:hypothetical protein [Streptosporangium roseum]ACZ90869.1 hypothetical protein Sros_8219 [Streptosporangium roseum DSM 43021]
MFGSALAFGESVIQDSRALPDRAAVIAAALYGLPAACIDWTESLLVR